MAETAGDLLVETLLRFGVDTIFGIPGDGINGIMEALRTRQDKIRFIQVRHDDRHHFTDAALIGELHENAAGYIGYPLISIAARFIFAGMETMDMNALLLQRFGMA